VKHYFIDNREPENSLARYLCRRIKNAKKIRFAVAFGKTSGWHLIKDDIETRIQSGTDIEMLIGLDLRITDASLVRNFMMLGQSYKTFRVFCFCDPRTDDVPFYHPKVYVVDGSDESFISVGSSNLTNGGLKGNIEMNLAFEGPKDDEYILDLRGLYPLVKGRGRPFVPDSDFVEAYEELTSRSKQARTQSKEDEIVSSLKKLSDTMLRVSPSAEELVGWQKLVFGHIPDGEFTNEDMYSFQDEFKSHYPENMYVTDKIRQVLQQLRDMGFLEHVGEGRWRKPNS